MIEQKIKEGKLVGFYLSCQRRHNEGLSNVMGKRWNPGRRAWDIPLTLNNVYEVASYFKELPEWLENWYEEERDRCLRTLQIHEAEDAELAIPQAKKLYPYQRIGVKFLVEAERVILADDMGLGKTPVSILACKEAGLSKILVICPNSLKDHWHNQVLKWEDYYIPVVVEGSKKKRLETLESLPTENVFVIVNYELVREKDYYEILEKYKWNAIISDESHVLRNRKTKQTKTVTSLTKKSRYLFLLTGTPIMNRVEELWSLCHMAYPNEYTSFWNFVKKHADARPGKYGWIINSEPTDPKKLREEIEKFYIRREKDEVRKDLPPRTHQAIWVDLEGEQERVYREMEQDAVAILAPAEVLTAPIVLAQITRLKQMAVSQDLVSEDPGVIHGSKIQALMDIIEGTNQKIVVFSQFAKAMKLLSDMLNKEKIGNALYVGKLKVEDRKKELERFREDKSCRVFLSTFGVGGVGLDLTAASIVVRIDKWWTPAVNNQAAERVHRDGQTKPVTIIDILAKDTVDEWIEEVLDKKTSIIDLVVNKIKERK